MHFLSINNVRGGYGSACFVALSPELTRYARPAKRSRTCQWDTTAYNTHRINNAATFNKYCHQWSLPVGPRQTRAEPAAGFLQIWGRCDSIWTRFRKYVLNYNKTIYDSTLNSIVCLTCYILDSRSVLQMICPFLLLHGLSYEYFPRLTLPVYA